jgi:hypothetical protein
MPQSLIMAPAQSFLHLAKHPAVALITGAILLASGIEEALKPFLGELSPFGLEHGAIALGLFTCLRAFAELVEATEWLDKGRDAQRSRRGVVELALVNRPNAPVAIGAEQKP